MPEQSELTADDLQHILKKISENQLDGIRALQDDTNKYFVQQLDKLSAVISVAAKSHPRGVPQPSVYSGKLSEDFAQWVCQFRAIASLNHWHSDELPKILPLYLQDVALTYFQSLPVDIRENFEQAVSALKNRFDDQTIRTSLHMQLRSQKQSLTQSVDDYCFSLEKLFLRLNINDDFYKLLLFVEGLQSNIQLEIRKLGPLTYEEAKTIARNVEAAVCSTMATADISVISTPKSEPSANIEETLAALQSEFDLLNKSLTEIKSTLKYNSGKCTC